MHISIVGIPWYREEHYPTLRAQFADGELLAENWGAWHKAAPAVADHFRAEGIPALEVLIRPDVFSDWCNESSLPQDAESRNLFATASARECWMEAGRVPVLGRARSICDRVDASVVALFTYRDDDRFDFAGSGVLCRLDDHFFLVTAAHVFDNCAGGVFLGDLEGEVVGGLKAGA